jgi:hypothetical protein
MAKQTNDYKPIGFRNECVVFTNADGTTTKDLVVADADDSVIVQMSVASQASAATTLRLYLYDGTTSYFLVDIQIPAAAGVGSVDAVDILSLPFIYNASLPLSSGWTLRAAPLASIPTSGDVTVTIVITDY